MSILEGGCLCGAIRFRATGKPTNTMVCHCQTCRRAAGSPVVAWLTFDRKDFRITRGKLSEFNSTPPVTRGFCGTCGTPLTFESTRFPDETDVTICSLDDPEQVPPRDHTRAATKLTWVKLADVDNANDIPPDGSNSRNDPTALYSADGRFSSFELPSSSGFLYKWEA